MGRTIHHFFPDLAERMNEPDDPRSKEGLYSLAEFKTLINRKVFTSSRFLGKYYCIALDGTGLFFFDECHCDHCLTKTIEKGHYFLSKKAIKWLRNEGLPKWVLQGPRELTDRKFETTADFFLELLRRRWAIYSILVIKNGSKVTSAQSAKKSSIRAMSSKTIP